MFCIISPLLNLPPFLSPSLPQSGLTALDVATNSDKGDTEGVCGLLHKYMQESATTQSHHVRLGLLWCHELVSLMFTQDDGVPPSGTGSISGQESDQSRPSAGDDKDTISTSRGGLSEVKIHCTHMPISATLIAAPPTASLSLPPPPPLPPLPLSLSLRL